MLAAWDWVGGSIVAGVFALILIGTVIGFYTRRGSGIDEHPVDDRARSPGAQGPATTSGAGRTTDRSPSDKTLSGGFSDHGTR
jgi:hypothetical protein